MNMKFSLKNTFCILCLSLFVVSGCDSNRNAVEKDVQNNNGVVTESENNRIQTPKAQPTETLNTNQAKTDSPVVKASNFDSADFAHFKPEHAAALKVWLSRNKLWKPARESDYNQEFLEYAKKDESRKNYHPYYTTGDFNKDGKEDFGVGLVDSKTRKKLAFAVFNAPFADGKAAFFTDQTEKDDIIIFNNGSLYLGPDYSDSGYVLVPKGDKYEVESLFADP